MIVFGPVPSRRLGQSLGINNIPPKTCTYECIYCQVGPTPVKEVRRQHFYDPQAILEAVREKIRQVKSRNARIDYLTLVPDGEPTLDIHLGQTIELLRPLGYKIAVITNASLLWREDVRTELGTADCISLKMDAVEEDTWRKINRPHPSLSIEAVLDGALRFSKTFKGELLTETMLIAGVNDAPKSLELTLHFLKKLQPAVAFLAVPTRPTSERWAKMPDEQSLTQAYQLFAAQLEKVELLTGFAGDAFSVTGDVVEDLLAITSVHPMRESEALDFFEKGGVGMPELERLIAAGKIVRVVHDGQPFYVRKLAFGSTN